MPSVLIVDDEPNIRRMLGSLLRVEGYTVREAGSAREGLAAVQDSEPDAMLMDLVMPDVTGLEVLPEIRETSPELPIIMMSGRASLSDAVRATKLGAFHFLEKPLTPESVLVTLRSALELRQTREVNRALRAELGANEEMVGESAPMRRVRELIERVAHSDARVLITGESGTGKELAAAAIHRLSRRAAGPFIRVNCAAIPRDLVESELFGHEKGSFTGATERRRGRFELADGGTLLLDEVGDLGPEAQAKLLRVLEAGDFERVGGNDPIKVDVRTLAATNRDLRADIDAGRFREDLFFRLHVVPVHLPPLRERPGDVPLLVDHLLARQRVRTTLHPPQLTTAALDVLSRQEWPGNVRELANIVERLVILHSGTSVGVPEIQALLRGGPARRPSSDGYRADDPRTLTQILDDHERSVIRGAIEAHGGNVAEAARHLSTDRANLYRRMRRLGIER